jgi:uracil-DNA glycosylase
MHPSWKEKLNPMSDLAKKALNQLIQFNNTGVPVYPHFRDWFAAFNMPFDSVKVVIIGQDPYHGEGQANGLAFSVNKGVWVPPSLINIYTEVNKDIGCSMASHGDLTDWMKQGVLLLNTSLTVQAGKPGSHKDIGWYPFVQGVIDLLNKEHENLVFILWGKHAQEFEKVIDNKKHLIIKSAHPSPYSADKGFFGSKPFSKTNEYLKSKSKQSIDWEIK